MGLHSSVKGTFSSTFINVTHQQNIYRYISMVAIFGCWVANKPNKPCNSKPSQNEIAITNLHLYLFSVMNKMFFHSITICIYLFPSVIYCILLSKRQTTHTNTQKPWGSKDRKFIFNFCLCKSTYLFSYFWNYFSLFYNY